MRRKDQFIDVVGEWDGTDTGEVALWLTENGYIFGIQTEDAEQIGWRTKGRKDESTEPTSQLVIVGKRLYDETTLVKGNFLGIYDDRLTRLDADFTDDYEDI